METGKLMAGSNAICKLCKSVIAHFGGTTTLKNLQSSQQVENGKTLARGCARLPSSLERASAVSLMTILMYGSRFTTAYMGEINQAIINYEVSNNLCSQVTALVSVHI